MCTQESLEVGLEPAPLCPQVPKESIKAPVEPCVALTLAPWERTPRKVRFGSLSSPNLQRAAQNRTMESWELEMLEACILKRDRERIAGDREGTRESPPTPTRTIQRAYHG